MFENDVLFPFGSVTDPPCSGSAGNLYSCLFWNERISTRSSESPEKSSSSSDLQREDIREPRRSTAAGSADPSDHPREPGGVRADRSRAQDGRGERENQSNLGTGQIHRPNICRHSICCHGSGPGLDEFKEFLRGRAGETVLGLWMDIERVKSVQNRRWQSR